MSVKIHNGYRLAAGTDLWQFTERLRTLMNPLRDRLDAAIIAREAVALVVAADASGQPRPRNPAGRAYETWRSEQRAMSKHDHGHDPNRFEVSFGVAPGGDGRILCLLYAQAPEFRDAWEALPEVETYDYWNNSDPDPDVSEREWQERRETWDRLGVLDASVVERTLTFALRPDGGDFAMFMLARRRVDPGDEQRRQELLRSSAPDERAALSCLLDPLLVRTSLAAGLGGDLDDDGNPVDSRAILRLCWQIRTAARDHPDAYAAVRDAARAVLGYDAVLDAALDALPFEADDTQRTHPLDLTEVRSVAAAFIEQTLRPKDHDA